MKRSVLFVCLGKRFNLHLLETNQTQKLMEYYIFDLTQETFVGPQWLKQFSPT